MDDAVGIMRAALERLALSPELGAIARAALAEVAALPETAMMADFPVEPQAEGRVTLSVGGVVVASEDIAELLPDDDAPLTRLLSHPDFSPEERRERSERIGPWLDDEVPYPGAKPHEDLLKRNGPFYFRPEDVVRDDEPLTVSESRAILVSSDQRMAWGAGGYRAAVDAAGDQPPRKVCMTHQANPYYPREPCPGHAEDCRVVDAIVVPLEGV